MEGTAATAIQLGAAFFTLLIPILVLSDPPESASRPHGLLWLGTTRMNLG